MTRYEREFATDWETLDLDAAAERAYALGVAEALGEEHRTHLDRIVGELDAAYERTIVQLAYDEGRREATDARTDAPPEQVWSTLVEDGTASVTVDPDELPTGGRDGLPEALTSAEFLDVVDIDSTGALDRPEFLDR